MHISPASHDAFPPPSLFPFLLRKEEPETPQPRHLHFMSATVSTISGQLRKAKIGAIELEAPLGIGTMFWGESFVDSLFGPIPPFQDLK